MSTHNEIERKFLVPHLPAEVARLAGIEIEQGYLAIDLPHRAEVRLRRIGGQRVLTVKTASGANMRAEGELELSAEQFEELWPATPGRRLRKTRYMVPQNGCVIEVDVYHGRVAGLIVAEVEFPNAESCASFQKAGVVWRGRFRCAALQQLRTRPGMKSPNRPQPNSDAVLCRPRLIIGGWVAVFGMRRLTPA